MSCANFHLYDDLFLRKSILNSRETGYVGRNEPIYIPNYKRIELTPWRTVILQKLIDTQLVKKSRLLWYSKVHYRSHKGPLVVPILNQMDQVHILPYSFTKIRSNIIVPSTPMSSEWSVPSRHFRPIFYASPISPMCYMSRPSHPP
jgi:hypothetical protein